MKRVEAAHRYDVPVERGFAFITDTANWSKFWPGYVRLEDGSSWGAAGDTARLMTRLLGRERELTMTITAFEPNRLVTYASTQPGLPDARHERHFEPDGEGFVYRLVVEYEPRAAGSPASSTGCCSRAESGARSRAPSLPWSGSYPSGHDAAVLIVGAGIAGLTLARPASARHHGGGRGAESRVGGEWCRHVPARQLRPGA